jgi:hypothetical protein
LIGESSHRASFPSFLELDPRNGRHHVDPNRWNADLKDYSRLAEIVGGQLLGGSSKEDERLKRALRVRGIGTDPDIEFASGSYLSMDGQGMSPDDQEFNVVRVEFGK